MNTIVFALSAFCAGALAGTGVLVIREKNKRNSTDEDDRQTTFLFSGNLQQTSIVDAVQFLEIGKREGILHVYCGRRKGYVTFSNGNVIDAFYRNNTGRDAMFEMLDLQEGDFYFEPKKIHQPRLISESIMDIVLAWDSSRQEP